MALELKSENRLNGEGLDLLFRRARTYNAWLQKDVPDSLLHEIYDLAKLGPTSANSSPAQSAYLIVAFRALGLDCSPMSGFDAAGVNQEFFPDGKWKINFICNLGYGDPTKLFGRLPRLRFEDTAVIL